MAQLLDLPEEVLESGILPFLSWNDLLRCRRVCKTIKVITDDYIRLNPKKAPEIEVTAQTGKDLKTFTVLGIPTTKLFVNNPNGHHFYDNLDSATLSKFAMTYGPLIESFRVLEFSVSPCYNEWTFLEALTNLKTFAAGHFGFGVVPAVDQVQRIALGLFERAKTDPRFLTDTYPQNLKNVEVLKIGPNKQYSTGVCCNYFGYFLHEFLKLDYLSFPFYSALGQPIDQPLFPSHPSNDMIGKVVVSVLKTINHAERKHLQQFDFINYHEARGLKIEVVDELHSRQSLDFLMFITVCNRFGVKLLNVNPAWYHQRMCIPLFDPPYFGIPVVSLVNLHACIFPLEMPNLEKINICQTSRSNVSPTWNARPDWPALRSLEINVNSKKAVETETPTQDTTLLFKFLWKDIVRGQLTELIMKFEDKKGKDRIAIPKLEDIASGCPNLRKLRIENWPGTNKQLTKLWSGLPGLEELALEYCKELGNVAFVGEDVKDPVFFRLKSLKKLTLKGLDEMPKITDTLFSLVLAKIKLTHFIIRADKPLEKITKVGITALLEGIFAETIEKFSFHGWSLGTMSSEDFQEISQRFRSYNML